MLKGFKDFISRGNVMDLAIGVIIGAAFGKVVDALVNSVLMPAISTLVGSPSFDDFLVVGEIKFGVLLTALVNFLIVAAAVYFAIVLPLNKMAERRAAKEGITAEEVMDPQVELLTQIRDELKANPRI
ncbi:large conductance mechanosensitive channel protein MscL [Galactobacter caseinivorans]|uniref:Large-conductance mechanosensitive channel n=1 Tax=Galactobacter caseinivorans TaxID=2676123 RepID=A0A496PLT3_9MICC|nr:large conductance mechanosensitive channel protein MscL [Galactobacter caseinivorans]RKW71498.1 large conductance mechanosensitive channel protein MscL [Galactobacter caseinivorans]